MSILVTEELLNTIMVSITLSIIVMTTIQKIKNLTFIKSKNMIWFINLFLSFIIGLPFSIYFYDFDILSSIWISFFTFVGASNIYHLLKKQNIINYTPKSCKDNNSENKDKVLIDKLNIIKRNDEL